MKTSIDHLPADKQAELMELVEAIAKRLPTEMIILFGSYARGNWVDDRYVEDGITYEYKSDFDLLVVIDSEVLAIQHENSKRWRKRIRRDSVKETPLNVIFHGIEYLNSEIEDGNYFFMDVLNEGIMLQNSGRFTLSEPKQLTANQRKTKAKNYFDKWFESANDFFQGYNDFIVRGKFSKCAFELHQATERYFMTALLVFTDYKPKLHDLDKLYHQVMRLDNRFKVVFPRESAEEKRLFELLKQAYIDSRYKLDYKITAEELAYLTACVEKLRELTEVACKEKIEELG